MLILMLSNPQDGHVDPIAQIIRQRGGEVVWVDLADVPFHLTLSSSLQQDGWKGSLQYQDHSFDIEQIQSVWWRRPTNPVPPPGYSPAEGVLWGRENERGFTSMFLSIPGASHPFWVSSPDAIHLAARKPLQLATAQKLGLRVPRTILTNNPESARAFYHECAGQVICKAIARGVLDPDGEYQLGQERFIYTNSITSDHLDKMDQIQVMLHLFQERIQKKMDLRVIIIGAQVFAIEIHSPDQGPVALDWRRDYSQISYAVHQLPQEIEQKLVQLVRSYGLQFSSMDVILSQEGEYVFIEQNPNGQFLFPARATGLPLAEAMANLLLSPEEYAL